MKKRYVAGALALVAAWQSADARLWINEVMQSNIDCVFTSGDFPDSWFEIYNDGDAAVRLNGYRVGTSEDFSKAYTLTGGSLGVGAKNYNLIYCDKVASGYHTDFRIDSGKGKLFLFSPDGEIIDSVSFPKMPAPNVAYGRVADGGEEWGYELCVTPRAANGGGVTSVILPDPVFSAAGSTSCGVRRLVEVTVSMPQGVELPADTRLYVTTDGSEPTTESPSYGSETTLRSSGTLVVRAKLMSAEAISPRAATQSYIFHPRESEMPIIALSTNQDYLDDPKTGLWQNFEENWRRPVNVEYFPASGEAGSINQLGEFRIHGGWSRNQVQKSLAVYSNKRFGTKKYSYPFWDDKPDVKKSKSFVLRNGGNCFTEARINDSFVQTLFGRNCDNLDWQAYRPVICYINGAYRGIYALRQRSNEDYVDDCYDGLEDIDMFENWEELKAGTTDNFDALRALYEGNPTYEQMEQAIDVENFANLYIANAWATNTDFPGNNIVMWRPTAEEGKWRWIMKDLDFLASNPHDFNYFDFVLHTGSYSNNFGEGNAHHAVKLFKVMTGLPEFRDRMIDRFFVYLGDFLRPSVTAALIDEQRDVLSPEYRAHLACYGNPTSYEWWNNRVDNLKQWCAARTEAMPGIICSYFGLGEPAALSIDGGGATVSINGVAVKGEQFEGKWPTGREFTVTGDNPDMGWKVTVEAKNGRRNTYEVKSNEHVMTAGANVAAVRMESYQLSGVDDVMADNDARVRVNVCGNRIVVEASDAIDEVNVTDFTGRRVVSERPMTGSAQLTLGRGGVYVVEVVLGNGCREVRKVMI